MAFVPDRPVRRHLWQMPVDMRFSGDNYLEALRCGEEKPREHFFAFKTPRRVLDRAPTLKLSGTYITALDDEAY